MTSITAGWVARHTPKGPGGRHAALIDIAQDLLLGHLHEQGLFEHLVFKGGTALRKLYGGSAGRFSTDLDFSVRAADDDPAAVADLLCGAIDGTQIDGFGYRVEKHRGRPRVHYETPFGGVGSLTTKLDIGPPPWLPPDDRGWVRQAIHQAYELPRSLPVMALEENLAEKVARLTRRTPARDVYDLVWIATTSPHSGFRRRTVRRLAVLKNWADQHGLSSPPAMWEPVAGAVRYDSALWLSTRKAADFDDESIGLLAVPPPSLDELGVQLRRLYEFLAEPDEVEQQIIAGGAGSRPLVLGELDRLDGSRLAGRQVY